MRRSRRIYHDGDFYFGDGSPPPPGRLFLHAGSDIFTMRWEQGSFYAITGAPAAATPRHSDAMMIYTGFAEFSAGSIATYDSYDDVYFMMLHAIAFSGVFYEMTLHGRFGLTGGAAMRRCLSIPAGFGLADFFDAGALYFDLIYEKRIADITDAAAR